MELPFTLGNDAKVNLHLQVDDRAYVLQLSAPLGGCSQLLAPEFEPRVRELGPLENNRDWQRIERFRVPIIKRSDMETNRLLAKAIGGSVIRVNLMGLLRDRVHSGPFKLHTLTIGNTSNTDYLLAGSTGNRAGATFDVGTPKFVPLDEE